MEEENGQEHQNHLQLHETGEIVLLEGRDLVFLGRQRVVFMEGIYSEVGEMREVLFLVSGVLESLGELLVQLGGEHLFQEGRHSLVT